MRILILILGFKGLKELCHEVYQNSKLSDSSANTKEGTDGQT